MRVFKMKKFGTFIVLSALTLFSVAPMVGCGGEDDAGTGSGTPAAGADADKDADKDAGSGTDADADK